LDQNTSTQSVLATINLPVRVGRHYNGDKLKTGHLQISVTE